MHSSKGLSNVYRRIDLETGVGSASAHQLITMLFNGALDAMKLGKSAMAAGDVSMKCTALTKAVQIVDEGLKASLNMTDGGELSGRLHDLYTYVSYQLTLSNVRNQGEMVDECIKLMTPIRDAWVAIAPKDAEVVRVSMEVRA